MTNSLESMSGDDCTENDDIRRELQIAFDQVDRDDVSELDMGALLAEAHRRYEERLRDGS